MSNISFNKVDDYNFTVSVGVYHVATIYNNINGVRIAIDRDDLFYDLSLSDIKEIHNKMQEISTNEFREMINKKLFSYGYYIVFVEMHNEFKLHHLNGHLDQYFDNIDSLLDYIQNNLKIDLKNC